MTLARGPFDPSRLTEAREARGITRTDLAKQLEVSKQAASQYEKGQRSPSEGVLFRMSISLNVPLHFFLTRQVTEVGEPVFFRSMAAATKTARVSARRKYGWTKQVVNYMRELVEFPAVNFPSFSVPANPIALRNDEIEEMAAETRRFWGLGDGPISNLIWLLENNGAIVVRRDLGIKTLDAFSEWSSEDDTPYFVLGEARNSAVRSRFDAGHELGHMVLHRNVKNLQTSTFRLMEDQAHYFAGAFLLPAPSFSQDIMPTLRSLVMAKEKWKVSIAAMIKRMGHLRLITPARERRMFANMSRRGWRTREPLDEKLEVEEPRFIRRAFDLLVANGLITADDIEARLGLYIEDVENASGLGGYFRERNDGMEYPRIIPFE